MVCPGKAASIKLCKFRQCWTERQSSWYPEQDTNQWHPEQDTNGEDSFQILKQVPRFHRDDFELDHLLGQGGFSNVFQANLVSVKNSTSSASNKKKSYALKQLKPSIKVHSKLLPICAADLVMETAVLSSLQYHSNIIQLHGIKDGNMMQLLQEGDFFLVLDRLKSETLNDRMISWRKQSNSQKRRSLLLLTRRKRGPSSTDLCHRIQHVVMGIVKGMEFLHDNGILYRDLKPANIGFDLETDELKIFDFGLARCITDSDSAESRKFTRKIGTPRFMAPEMIRGSSTYGYGVDVYSFMILVWQIVTDRVAFESVTTPAELKKQVSLYHARPPLLGVGGIDEFFHNFFTKGWSDQACERPSYSQIRQELECYLQEQKKMIMQAAKAKQHPRRLLSNLLRQKGGGQRDTKKNMTKEILAMNTYNDDDNEDDMILIHKTRSRSMRTVVTDSEQELEV